MINKLLKFWPIILLIVVTFILFLGKLNPISWGWASALIAMITAYMMYIVGKSFADKKVGFTAATLWAFSYLANVYDRHLWALYWGPIVSLIALYFFYKLITTSHTLNKFTILLGIVIALSIHADPS